MGESHTKGEQRHYPTTVAGTDSRSAMARASDARPFKPYVWNGDRESPAVIQARERHRALDADLQRRRGRAAAAIADTAGPGPDEGGYEWRREQLLEDGGAAELAEADAARGRYREAQAALDAPPEPEPAPAPPPVAAPVRCRRCKYLTTSAGHRVMCDG